MSRSAKLRILSYDISNDSKRRRVARILENIGTRVQFSVFEARLTKLELDRVIKKSLAEIDEGDSLRIYTVGLSGERQCHAIGACPPIETDVGFWLM